MVIADHLSLVIIMTTSGEARGGYEKYFTGGLHTLHESSTKEEIEECYDKWADAYDRVGI